MSPSDPPPRPWYRDGVRFECQQSGRCCKSRGAYGHVYFDDAEAAAAARLLGIDLPEFERRYCRFDDGLRETRFVDGACVFLDGHACRVYEARPVQCRTWPFWRSNLRKATWQRDVVGFCPGVGKGREHSRAEIEAIARASEEEAAPEDGER